MLYIPALRAGGGEGEVELSANTLTPPNVGVLHEPIVGAFGLPDDTPFVSIKGDPSLRETVPLRPRQKSRLDHIARTKGVSFGLFF